MLLLSHKVCQENTGLEHSTDHCLVLGSLQELTMFSPWARTFPDLKQVLTIGAWWPMSPKHNSPFNPNHGFPNPKQVVYVLKPNYNHSCVRNQFYFWNTSNDVILSMCQGSYSWRQRQTTLHNLRTILYLTLQTFWMLCLCDSIIELLLPSAVLKLSEYVGYRVLHWSSCVDGNSLKQPKN